MVSIVRGGPLAEHPAQAGQHGVHWPETMWKNNSEEWGSKIV